MNNFTQFNMKHVRSVSLCISRLKNGPFKCFRLTLSLSLSLFRSRFKRKASLRLDSWPPVLAVSPGSHIQLNVLNGLFIGECLTGSICLREEE